MGLATLQTELARLLMESPRRAAFTADPTTASKKAGLRGRNADLLSSLDPHDLDYFATRRRVDRLVLLQAIMPRTSALLGSAGLHAFFAARPYGHDDRVREATHLAHWLSRTARASYVADVALFEATELRLLRLAYRGARPSLLPRRVPGCVSLALSHRVDGGDAARRPSPSFYALLRRRDGVTWVRYGDVEHRLVAGADGRTAAKAWLLHAVEGQTQRLPAARKAAAALQREGLLASPH